MLGTYIPIMYMYMVHNCPKHYYRVSMVIQCGKGMYHTTS